MAVKITRCCCCMPLKACVIIISLLWLIEGISVTVKHSLDLVLSDEDVALKCIYTIPMIIIYGLMIIGAVFGLFVVNCANTSRMLLVYSKIVHVVAIINILGVNMSTIAEIVLHGSITLNACISSIDNNQVKSIVNLCNQTYNDGVRDIIITSIISIFLLVYSTMIISAYAQKRKDKENAARHYYQNYIK